MDILFGAAISAHLTYNGDEYNFIHPQLRLEHNTYIAGAYYNSIEELSLYAGKEFNLTDSLSFEMGVVSGYNGDDVVMPFARAKWENLYVTPHFVKGEIEGAVVGFEWLLNFNR